MRVNQEGWSRHLVVLLLGVLFLSTAAPVLAQPGGAAWVDVPGFPIPQGNNSSCVVATHEQVSQCDYRGFAAGPAALQPGVSDQCFRECTQCCGVYGNMSPEDRVLFALTCECLAGAGVTIATEGAGVVAALAGCTGARFWVEQIPTLLEQLENGPDWLANIADWEDTAQFVDALINFGILTGDLAAVLQRQDEIGEQARALLRRELENPGQFDATRWARLAGGVVDWAGWAQWVYGTADWVFGFCDALQEHTEEGMGVACRNDCYDYFPPEPQPDDAGNPDDGANEGPIHEPGHPDPDDEGLPDLSDFDGPGLCDGTLGDRCYFADGDWGVITALCDCERVNTLEGTLCELDPDPVRCWREVCENDPMTCWDAFNPFRYFGGGSGGAWWLLFATQMY